LKIEEAASRLRVFVRPDWELVTRGERINVRRFHKEKIASRKAYVPHDYSFCFDCHSRGIGGSEAYCGGSTRRLEFRTQSGPGTIGMNQVGANAAEKGMDILRHLP
jgi:hypothetical protein